MEFLQALEKSQILGLTKEEFLSAWKTESELKKITYERRERKLRTSHTENIKQVMLLLTSHYFYFTYTCRYIYTFTVKCKTNNFDLEFNKG